MGTRATIKIARREEGVSFSEKPDEFIVSIYNHYDGYPEGLGVILAEYFEDKNFYSHFGIDIAAIIRATFTNILNKFIQI